MASLTALILATAIAQQDPQANPLVMDDGSLDFAKAVLKSAQDAPDLNVRLARLKPVVTGFYMWRLTQFAAKPFSKLERMHMNTSVLMLNFYYPGTQQKWDSFQPAIQAGKDDELPQEVVDWANKTVKMQVFDEYFSLSFDEKKRALSDKFPGHKGEFQIGITLGELTANMVTQFSLQGYEPVRIEMASNLKYLGELLNKNPLAFTPEIRTKLTSLSKLAKGDAVQVSEYRAIEAANKEVLMMIAKI
ncbi:MAG: hypothetical protein KDC26_07685 [Armatimonadetes bacterium]|nr:hypothetical protein [Armatimonadota bacterium]